MSKVKNVIIAFLIILTVAAAAFGYYVWYSTFDVSGLVFYDGEDIKEIYPYNDQIYVVTDNGAYVAGGYSATQNRRYRNSELYEDASLGIPSPVLFYQGKVTRVIPYGTLSALFINDKNELFAVEELEITYLASDVVSADRYSRNGCVYAIDKNGRLLSVTEGKTTVIYSGVKAVKTYRERVFVILENGDLCEMFVNPDGGSATLGLPLFENAREFDVVDTSLRYTGGKLVVDDETAIANPLFNVLDADGSLYVKGAYNLLQCGHQTLNGEIAEQPIKAFDSWTLISENVEAFGLSVMGTVMKFTDGSCAYYGFEVSEVTNTEFAFAALPTVESALSIHATEGLICASTETEYYMWGGYFNVIFDNLTEEHYIFSGTPYVLPKYNGSKE